MASNSWSGYPNGHIPVSKMVIFRNTGKYMQPDAANWLGQLLDAAARAGHKFTILPSEDLYRDYARQVYFWDNQKQLGIVAAYPGTSNHGWALAADVDGTQNAAAWTWIVKNAPSFHYKLKTVPSEKWHWVYTGPTTSTAGGGTTPVTPPATVTNRIKNMYLWYCTDNNGALWTLVDTANRVFAQTRDQATANLWAILYTDSNHAKDIVSSGNLAMAVPGYTSSAWPFPKK